MGLSHLHHNTPAPTRKVKAEDLQAGMENWAGTVYTGEGHPHTNDGLTTVCYTADPSEEYPLLDFRTYPEGTLIEIWA